MKLSVFFVALLAMIGVGLGLAHAAGIDSSPVIGLGMPTDLAMAAALMLPLNARARGIIGVRADASDASRLLAELQKTFNEFKAERDAEIKALKDKMGDVVQTEKVDRINNHITELQAAMDEANKSIAALRVGSAVADNVRTPERAAYASAFDKFFRKGVEAGLADLAVKASLKTDSDADGGYLVPEEMATEIDRVLTTVSAMRNLAQVITISTGNFKKPVNTGGTASGWVGERESRSETNTPSISLLDFPVMEIYANPPASQTMLDDGMVDVGAWLADEVAVEFAEEEGAAFVTGSGVNRPRGFLSYDTVANASWTWGKLGFVVTGVAADINDASNNGMDGIIDLAYALKQGYRANASFLMNRTLQGKVRKLKDLGSGSDAYIWQPSSIVGQPATILGYPVIDDDNMPNVAANAFPIAFGDFRRGYLIVDRFGVRVLRDPFTNKPYVHFYTTKRVGGGVQNYEAIKLLKCST